MARQSASTRTASSTAKADPRPRVDPSRKQLGLAVLMVLFGSFMPWIDTAIGAISGSQGPGLWTFYAAMFGLAGALVPWRRVAALQASVLALVAVGLTSWQVIHLINLVGFGGWVPGPGLVLVVGGGILAGVVAVRMWRAVDVA